MAAMSYQNCGGISTRSLLKQIQQQICLQSITLKSCKILHNRTLTETYTAALSAFDRKDVKDWEHIQKMIDWNEMHLTPGLDEGTDYVIVNF